MGRDILAPRFWNFKHPIMIDEHVAVEDVIISEIMAIWWNMPRRAFDVFLRGKYHRFAIECRASWLRRHKLHVHVLLMMIHWWVHRMAWNFTSNILQGVEVGLNMGLLSITTRKIET
jgi:hypothetical protein